MFAHVTVGSLSNRCLSNLQLVQTGCTQGTVEESAKKASAPGGKQTGSPVSSYHRRAPGKGDPRPVSGQQNPLNIELTAKRQEAPDREAISRLRGRRTAPAATPRDGGGPSARNPRASWPSDTRPRRGRPERRAAAALATTVVSAELIPPMGRGV